MIQCYKAQSVKKCEILPAILARFSSILLCVCVSVSQFFQITAPLVWCGVLPTVFPALKCFVLTNII